MTSRLLAVRRMGPNLHGATDLYPGFIGLVSAVSDQPSAKSKKTAKDAKGS